MIAFETNLLSKNNKLEVQRMILGTPLQLVGEGSGVRPFDVPRQG